MDLESKPLHIFVKEALMRTAQGRVVIMSFVVYWLLSVCVFLHPATFLSSPEIMLGALIVFLPWPLVSLLITLILSSPPYRSDSISAVIVTFCSGMPLWWVYL
jgi:hypothetical protein